MSYFWKQIGAINPRSDEQDSLQQVNYVRASPIVILLK